jgi:glucose/mannose-6-phosphate isomerase
VEAWVTPRATEEEKVALLLRSTLDDPVLLDRYSIAEALLQRSNIGHRIVETDGATPLSQILNMLLLGDYVSYYLAILKGVDPSPTPAITAGKEMLGSGQ